jgi:hypothetical protein
MGKMLSVAIKPPGYSNKAISLEKVLKESLSHESKYLKNEKTPIFFKFLIETNIQYIKICLKCFHIQL